MEINIPGNGKMTKGMKKELWIGQMEINLTVNG